MEKVVKHLQDHGISKRWLARQIGVSDQTVQNWKNGKKISKAHKIAIAAVLDKDYANLWVN